MSYFMIFTDRRYAAVLIKLLRFLCSALVFDKKRERLDQNQTLVEHEDFVLVTTVPVILLRKRC